MPMPKKNRIDKKELVIYWAPQTEPKWNLLYSNPTYLYADLAKEKNTKSGSLNMLSCPAVINKFSHTLVFNFPIPSSYVYDFSNEEAPVMRAKDANEIAVGCSTLRPPTLRHRPLVTMNLYYMFFCEEPLMASFTPPYFHEPKYLKQGAVSAGNFDIGRWFRPYPIEIMLWKDKGELDFEEGEPLFYVEFMTERPIVLKRFKASQDLLDYSSSGAQSSILFEKRVPLTKRYQRFKETSQRELVLKEIHENLLD